MNRFKLVEDHKNAFGVKRFCEVIGIARSSFYAWVAPAPTCAAKVAEGASIAARIRLLQDRKRGGDPAYGAPRITDDLNEGDPAGQRINRKQVARVMRQHG